MSRSRNRVFSGSIALALVGWIAFNAMHSGSGACTNEYAALVQCAVPGNVAVCASPPGNDCNGSIVNPRTGAYPYVNSFACQAGGQGTFCSFYLLDGRVAVAPCHRTYRCRWKFVDSSTDPSYSIAYCVPDLSFPVGDPVYTYLTMTFACPAG